MSGRDLRGRVAVVTGAASGIGRGLAEACAQRGARLALIDVDREGLAALAGRLREGGAEVSEHVADVSDRACMAAAADEVAARHGAVHLLVNNAGVAVGGTVDEQSFEDWEWILGINLWGVIHGVKLFLPHLRRAEWGHIVNLSSMLGFFGLPTQSSYCVSKAGVRALSEALWAELRDEGIGVTVVHPGGVRTGIVRASRTANPEARDAMAARFERFAATPERVAEKILRGALRGRMRVVVCPEAHVTERVKRLAPVGMHHLILRLYRRGGAFA